MASWLARQRSAIHGAAGESRRGDFNSGTCVKSAVDATVAAAVADGYKVVLRERRW
jgi:hypothetical protein